MVLLHVMKTQLYQIRWKLVYLLLKERDVLVCCNNVELASMFLNTSSHFLYLSSCELIRMSPMDWHGCPQATV